MRALVLSEFGVYTNLISKEVPEPILADDGVILSVRATAVNFADSLLVAGRYQFKPPLPFIPGKCPAGVIEIVGRNVSGFKTGDRVLTLADIGGFGERLAVKAKDCFLLPASMTFAEAASLSSIFDTAWIAIHRRGMLRSGETLAVLGGSSGVGLAATQLARATGANVLSIVQSSEKAGVARAAGARVIILPGSESASVRDEILRLTEGKGADVVVDLIGGPLFANTLRAVAWEGRVVIVGFASGNIPEIQTNYLLLKNISLSGMQISDYRRRHPDLIAQCWHDIFDLFQRGLVKPVPTVVWPIARAPEALSDLASRRAAARIVLEQADTHRYD
ncbi:MAG: NADPH:quinone oxidoreductase family protein [Pseudorhodoplanes sp.]|uniref:NADPH:quinone oxidoreductase family protein n=1 Tax=Pseudorhodoplanes sp. TaxID=1934341 RepID=UPI003D111794